MTTYVSCVGRLAGVEMCEDGGGGWCSALMCSVYVLVEDEKSRGWTDWRVDRASLVVAGQ